ncbi:MAG: tRNA (adenosine(37)-N6)-threonylcarbamoyltransferase complex transferase subunit TsaD [Pseudomonadota bacterium]
MTVLGIETSCDETAASVIRLRENEPEILSNFVYSQMDEHAEFGGVVPELAARAHVTKLDMIVHAALREARTEAAQITAVAATTGPGLIGALIVGAVTGRAIAQAWEKPFIPINHLEGHALTARLTDGVDFPYLLLLVSGGHTQILLVKGVGEYERWATTIDDALGEAFDKTAKLLGLPYPGGPAVEEMAALGNADRFLFPRPLKGDRRLDFSFSGLKSAVRKEALKLEPLSQNDSTDLCASFQSAVTDVLRDRISRALSRFVEMDIEESPTLVVAGGVAANKALRAMIQETCDQHDARFIAPPLNLCTDNAAMIAWAAIERLRDGSANTNDIKPRPRWPLDQVSEAMIGSGRKGAKV